jgi:hypothetical protein
MGSATAQKVKFNGTVTFSISYTGDIDPQKHVPKTYSVDIFGNKTKRINRLGAEASLYIITDGDSATTTILYDIHVTGDKVGYIDRKSGNEDDKTKVEIMPQSDKDKSICGYVCKCYKVTITDLEDDDSQDVLVWTTPEIGNSDAINSMDIKQLSGYPLCTIVEDEGVTITIEATEIKKGKLKILDFLIPTGYKIFATEEELGEWFQQLQGGGE